MFQRFENIEKYCENREKKLKKLKQPSQPFVIAVGQDISRIMECYVRMGNIMYQFDSVLHGLDACFKIFHVFDAKFPVEGEIIWQVIQKGLYDMSDDYNSRVLEIIADLNRYRGFKVIKSNESVETDNSQPSSSETGI